MEKQLTTSRPNAAVFESIRNTADTSQAILTFIDKNAFKDDAILLRKITIINITLSMQSDMEHSTNV